MKKGTHNIYIMQQTASLAAHPFHFASAVRPSADYVDHMAAG